LSSPDELARLKSIVDTYEMETQDSMNRIRNIPLSETIRNPNLTFDIFMREIESIPKLLSAYRAYTKELERYIPR
jgi:hypothetical protein